MVTFLQTASFMSQHFSCNVVGAGAKNLEGLVSDSLLRYERG
jgi:hypothetical protein